MTEIPMSALLALGGGALIGASASLLWLAEGRIAGISGILGGALVPRAGDLGWRLLFLAGLVAGGGVLAAASPDAIGAPSLGPALVVGAGLLVGVGTGLGRGCTSGHGVCGLPRLSPRSWRPDLAFVMVGAVVTYALGSRLAGARPWASPIAAARIAGRAPPDSCEPIRATEHLPIVSPPRAPWRSPCSPGSPPSPWPPRFKPEMRRRRSKASSGSRCPRAARPRTPGPTSRARWS